MTEALFKTTFGEFKLTRPGQTTKNSLRAWDAADEYLLQFIAEKNLVVETPLICNDAFGALSIALHHSKPVHWSDSFTAQQVLRINLQNNALAKESVNCLESTQSLPQPFDLVLIKLPKTLALLEQQLISLRPMIKERSTVLVAGMVKYMPSSVWTLLETLIGPTQTSRAVKKARVIEVSVNPSLTPVSNPYPVKWTLENTAFEIVNHANVFSRDKLDIGTRFMLQHLPQTDGEGDIVDLGCGNGVLGLIAAHQNPQARIHCVDESYMAIASARENFKQLDSATYSSSQQINFYINDRLSDFEENSVDLVLCNPPFHQNQMIGEGIARNMFRQAAQVLGPGCELWVVGNRHLGYHQKLRSHFDRVHLVASNKKFVILKAKNPD